MPALPNPMPHLDPATEAALRASIQRHGVIVPVIRDQHGRLLDGHHRARIAGEVGVEVPEQTRTVRDDDEARELAVTLNTDRRHLTVEQRREIVADLREQGHSLRAIAGAVGVGKDTVAKDLRIGAVEIDDTVAKEGVRHIRIVRSDTDADVSTGRQLPEKVVGRDGKQYPAEKPRVGPSKRKMYGEALAEMFREREQAFDAQLADAAAGPEGKSRARGQYDRLAKLLGQCDAMTRALPSMKVSAVVKATDPQEIHAFADGLHDAAHALLAFERRLRDASERPDHKVNGA